MRSTRERLAVLAVAFAVVATARAANRVVVEDWSSYPLGTRGIPGDWKGQNWSQPAYDLEIVADNGQPVLRLRSKGETSTIGKQVCCSWSSHVPQSVGQPCSTVLRNISGSVPARANEYAFT